MPGRAVGVGAGVSLGGASVVVPASGVSLAGGAVGDSAGSLGLGASVAVAVEPTTATDESWVAVPVVKSKGSVQVGTGVRARVGRGGAGRGLQAASAKIPLSSHKTTGYRRISRYFIPIKRGA